MGFFGVKVWSSDFWGVLVFAPFYHPCHVKSRVPSPLGVGCWPGACSLEFLVGVCCRPSHKLPMNPKKVADKSV